MLAWQSSMVCDNDNIPQVGIIYVDKDGNVWVDLLNSYFENRGIV